MENNTATVSQRLKDLIDHSSYTRTEIANKAGISKQTLYKYENGIVTNIPSDKIELFSRIFHVSPAYLMCWDNEEIEAAAEVQIDADIYYDHIEAELKAIIDDIIKLHMTKEELSQVLDYAGFIKSRRK